jgi:BON domain
MDNSEKRRPLKKHLKLVERYDSDEPFELGEQDFSQLAHTDKRNIHLLNEGSWTNPGVSGKSDNGEAWINQQEYKKQADFVGYGPKGYKRSDDRIYEEVCEILMRHPDVDATNIGVKVESGVVNLSGKVSSRRMKKMAEIIIEDSPGVQDVRNELVVIRGKEEMWGPDKAAKKDLGLY